MTEKATVLRAVRDARREAAAAPRRSSDDTRLRACLAEPPARVRLLPGRFRGADYVRRHVEFVLTLDSQRGEQHVRRNLDAIRHRLAEIGVDKRDADREVRSIESAVRREIWQRVLLP